MSPEVELLLTNFTIFVLAILCGFAVISKVPATLHTPLMSGAFIAVAFASMNVVGGYVVTDRMLQMFRRKPAAPAPKADEAEA